MTWSFLDGTVFYIGNSIMMQKSFQSYLQENILEELRGLGYSSLSSLDVLKIIDHFHRGGSAVGAHRIDDSDNQGVCVWLTEGSSGDGSVVMHIRDFKRGDHTVSVNVLRGSDEVPKHESIYNDAERYSNTVAIELKYPSVVDERSRALALELQRKVPLLNTGMLFDVENSSVVIAIIDGCLSVVARSFSIEQMARGAVCFADAPIFRMWPVKGVWKKCNFGAIQEGLFVVYGDLFSCKRVILCEGLATALTAKVAIERHSELSVASFCVIFTCGSSNMRKAARAVRAIGSDFLLVFYHNEGGSPSCDEVAIPSIHSGENWDWNDDVHRLMADGCSAEEAYARLGKHIEDEINSFLALKKEEVADSGVMGDPLSHGDGEERSKDFTSVCGEINELSLNLDLFPKSIRTILKDANGLNDPEGYAPSLSLILCLTGGIVGHRVKCGGSLERPFLYSLCVGEIGVGKSFRGDSLVVDAYENMVKEYLFKEIVYSGAILSLISGCYKIREVLNTSYLSSESAIEGEDKNTKLMDIFNGVKSESGDKEKCSLDGGIYDKEFGGLFAQKGYAEECVDNTYRQIHENQAELIKRSSEDSMAKDLSKVASGFSFLAFTKVVGVNMSSDTVSKLIAAMCPSQLFYYDEISVLLESEQQKNKNLNLIAQLKYLLKAHESRRTNHSMSYGCANIRNYIPQSLFLYGNITDGIFYRNASKGGFLDELSKNGFFGRVLICGDNSKEKSASQILKHKQESASRANKEAFIPFIRSLINIEASFLNPVEFLLGHIRIPFGEEVSELAARSIDRWKAVYRQESAGYDAGSMGVFLLKTFPNRIPSMYSAIYSIMFLLFAAEEMSEMCSYTSFFDAMQASAEEDPSEKFFNAFRERRGLHRFVNSKIEHKAAIAADEALNFLVASDFSVRSAVARRTTPYRSKDMECARLIYKKTHCEELGTTWKRPVVFVSHGRYIATYVLDPAKMASDCSWLFVPDKNGFMKSVIGNRKELKDFLDKNSVEVPVEFKWANEKDQRISVESSVEDFEGKLFIKISGLGRNNKKTCFYAFNFFDKSLVEKELCHKENLKITYLRAPVDKAKRSKENSQTKSLTS